MKIKTSQYIFPPRPTKAIPRDQTTILGEMGWLAQLKYNDSRCLVKYLPSGKIELWNRHGEQFRTYNCPDWLEKELQTVRIKLNLTPGELHLLDGGLLDQKHKAIKDTIAIWDILVKNGQHLVGTTYTERYNSLLNEVIATKPNPWCYRHGDTEPYKLGLAITEHCLIPENHPAQDWPELWDMINTINAPWTIGTPKDTNYSIKPLIEGLVFKDPIGTLGYGFQEKNNSDWVMRSRVTTGRHVF